MFLMCNLKKKSKILEFLLLNILIKATNGSP